MIYPGYQKFFLACDGERRRPQASLGSKRFQSSYCAKVRAGATKNHSPFLLSSQLSRRTRAETLATQANGGPTREKPLAPSVVPTRGLKNVVKLSKICSQLHPFLEFDILGD